MIHDSEILQMQVKLIYLKHLIFHVHIHEFGYINKCKMSEKDELLLVLRMG